jgi:hypothetical protein
MDADTPRRRSIPLPLDPTDDRALNFGAGATLSDLVKALTGQKRLDTHP